MTKSDTACGIDGACSGQSNVSTQGAVVPRTPIACPLSGDEEREEKMIPHLQIISRTFLSRLDLANSPATWRPLKYPVPVSSALLKIAYSIVRSVGRTSV